MAVTTFNDEYTIATFEEYVGAERAVDALATRGFPVEQLDIVGDGVTWVEHVAGRRGYPTATASGAVTGGVAGAVLAFVFGVFSWVDPLVTGFALGLYGLVTGAVVGALVGALAHWVGADRHTFDSFVSLEARRYTVAAQSPEVATEARRLLHG